MEDIYMVEVGNQKYIGRTINVDRRKRDYLSEAKRGVESKFFNALRDNNFNATWIVIESDVPYEKAAERKEYWIKYYDTIENGLNYNYGPGIIRHSEEVKKTLSEGKKGDNNPMKKPEVSAKSGNTQRGKKVSEETLKNMFEGQRHRRVPDDKVRAIRAERKSSNMSYAQLGKKYNVAAGTAWSVINNEKYSDVK